MRAGHAVWSYFQGALWKMRSTLRPPPPAFPCERVGGQKGEWLAAPLRQRMGLACGPQGTNKGKRERNNHSCESLNDRTAQNALVQMARPNDVVRCTSDNTLSPATFKTQSWPDGMKGGGAREHYETQVATT